MRNLFACVVFCLSLVDKYAVAQVAQNQPSADANEARETAGIAEVINDQQNSIKGLQADSEDLFQIVLNLQLLLEEIKAQLKDQSSAERAIARLDSLMVVLCPDATRESCVKHQEAPVEKATADPEAIEGLTQRLDRLEAGLAAVRADIGVSGTPRTLQPLQNPAEPTQLPTGAPPRENAKLVETEQPFRLRMKDGAPLRSSKGRLRSLDVNLPTQGQCETAGQWFDQEVAAPVTNQFFVLGNGQIRLCRLSAKGWSVFLADVSGKGYVVEQN